MIPPIPYNNSTTPNFYFPIYTRIIRTICISYICCFTWVFIYPNIAICLTIMNIKNYRMPVVVPGMRVDNLCSSRTIYNNSIACRICETICYTNIQLFGTCFYIKSETISSFSIPIPSIANQFYFNIIISTSYCTYIFIPFCKRLRSCISYI